MRPDQATFTNTMSRVRLGTLSAEHNLLCQRVDDKRGRAGVRAMEQRCTEALHKLMAAQLHAGQRGKHND